MKGLADKGLNTDTHLFQRIAESDEAAFEELFLRYVPKIEPVIINITGTDAVLKDIVQEVFLQLWINRQRLNDVQEPDNWIFRMVYNRSYSWLRQQVVRLRHQEAHSTSEEEKNTWQNPEEWLSFEETAQLVRQAIQSLSSNAQHIYQLKESGLKLQEIAEETGLSVDGVKKSLYRSSLQIRTFLTDRGITLPLFLLVWWLKK